MMETGNHFVPFFMNCLNMSINVRHDGGPRVEEALRISLQEIRPTLMSAVKTLAESGYVDRCISKSKSWNKCWCVMSVKV